MFPIVFPMETDEDIYKIISERYLGTTRDAIKGIYYIFRLQQPNEKPADTWIHTLNHVINVYEQTQK